MEHGSLKRKFFTNIGWLFPVWANFKTFGAFWAKLSGHIGHISHFGALYNRQCHSVCGANEKCLSEIYVRFVVAKYAKIERTTNCIVNPKLSNEDMVIQKGQKCAQSFIVWHHWSHGIDSATACKLLCLFSYLHGSVS